MNKVICVLGLGLRLLLFILANDRLKCCICQRRASKFSDTCDKRKFKSSVKYEKYFEAAFGLRPNEKRDGMICLGCVCAVYKWRKTYEPGRYTILTYCFVHLHAVPFYDPSQGFAVTWVCRVT